MLIVQEKSINFYRLATDTIITPRNNSCVAPAGVRFDGAMVDPGNPGVILATSLKTNTIEIFEGKGKGQKFSCKHRGSMRMPQGMALNKIAIQNTNSLLYLSFKDSNKLGIVLYDVMNMAKTLL